MADPTTLPEGALADHVIDSLETFESITGPPREVAGLYFYRQLDELIDLAHAIAHDFFARPQLYTDLGAPDGERDLASHLARLHARYGCEEFHLSREQRGKLYEAIFGLDETSQFMRGRDALLEAAAAFAERVFNTGVPMLRARVRNAHRSFKAYLTTLSGSSLTWSRQRALPPLAEKTAYRILRSGGITAVFGLARPPEAAWPYQVDSDGDKVVEEVSRQLDEPAGAPLTRECFNARQRVALRGAEAIATVLDFNEGGSDDDLDRLIIKCYTWYASIIDEGGMLPAVAMNGNRRLQGRTPDPSAVAAYVTSVAEAAEAPRR
jgi:hypothetical protein